MSLPTLFAARLAGRGVSDAVVLDAEEAGHLRSLRAAPGDALALTDGRGARWSARLEELRRDGARCVLGAPLPSPPPLPVRLAFAVAAKPRTLWLVEKAVELGVRALHPIETSRSRSVADGARSPAFWRRAARRARAALKQCGGAWLPRIEPPTHLGEWIREEEGRGGPRYVLEPGGEPLSAALAGWRGEPEALFLIGPEGGLEPGELAACEAAGFRRVRLGPRTLRFETAAVACLAGAVLHIDALIDAAAGHGPPSRGG